MEHTKKNSCVILVLSIFTVSCPQIKNMLNEYVHPLCISGAKEWPASSDGITFIISYVSSHLLLCASESTVINAKPLTCLVYNVVDQLLAVSVAPEKWVGSTPCLYFLTSIASGDEPGMDLIQAGPVMHTTNIYWTLSNTNHSANQWEYNEKIIDTITSHLTTSCIQRMTFIRFW